MARDYIREPKEFEERIIQIKRVSKKTKGGNKIGFTAFVVVGDRKGKVGVGLGKAASVSVAIQKALQNAKDDIVELKITGNTIPHEVTNKFKSSKILLKPAPVGSGIIAGGTVRDVIELVGIKDVSAKMLGSNNKNTNAHCAIEALKKVKFSEVSGDKNEAK